MAWLKPVNIIARDLNDAWFQALERVVCDGRVWTVERGSYVGQRRWELDFVTIHITHPGTRPLVPEIPCHLSHIPPPTTMEYVEEYLSYLMEDEPLKEHEVYTYGERVKPQMNEIIRRYKDGGFGSNQECISVSMPSDIALDDPPCMRSIDTRIVAADGLRRGEPQKLHFFPYFRSWCLVGGFPSNLAALRLMQEYMADQIEVDAGEMLCTSKGLHVYEFYVDMVKDIVGVVV